MNEEEEEVAQSQVRLNLRTTAQVIKQSSASFFSNLYTFLFLSLLLFSFRTTVENGTSFVTSFIDRDPSLKALLSHLDLSGKNHLKSQQHLIKSHHHHQDIGGPHHRRRRPFLHLSRVGTLDEDFFEEDDRYLFGLGRRSPVNGSSVSLSNLFLLREQSKSGFSDSSDNNKNNDDEIRFSQLVRTGFQFKTEGFPLSSNDDGGDGEEDDRRVSSPASEAQFFINGLELGRREAAMLLFLVSFLSAVYGWVILGFLIVNSCILGMVFYTVVNSHLGKYNSFIRTIWVGSRLGTQRLSGFILMRWAVRDAMTQIIGICFFGEIEDQHSFFKLFVRLKLMPFSVTSPWIRGYDSEISRFLVTWIFSDTFVALLFAVDSWVAIMDARSGREIVKEGFYLLSTMLSQAVQLKAYEAIFCGSFMRGVLSGIFGNMCATIVQSVVEVYFMVVWLIYYFAAKCKDANRDGRSFGRKDLEDYIDGLR